MKPMQLQEWRSHPPTVVTTLVEHAQANKASLVPKPSQPPLSLWSSAMLRRVKHPRLQFDKGVQVDVLA